MLALGVQGSGLAFEGTKRRSQILLRQIQTFALGSRKLRENLSAWFRRAGLTSLGHQALP